MTEEVKSTESQEQSTQTETESKTSEKQFSQEDFDNQLKKTLAEKEAKLEKKLAERLKQEREDWERQSSLTAEEKAKEEREKLQRELADKENSLALRENRADAREKLQEKGISADLVDFIVDVDADKTADNIDRLEGVFNQAVNEAVEKRLAGKTPEEKTPPKSDNKKSTFDLLYGKK